jgi:hypothetical protein
MNESKLAEALQMAIAQTPRRYVDKMNGRGDRVAEFPAWVAIAKDALASCEAEPANTEKLIAAAITRAGLTLVKTANGYEVRNFGRIEAQAEAKPADPGQLVYDIWAAAHRPNVGMEGQIAGIQVVLDREAKPAPAVKPVARVEQVKSSTQFRLIWLQEPVEGVLYAAPAPRNTDTHDHLSIMIGMVLGARQRGKMEYMDGSVMHKAVEAAIEHLTDWPYSEAAPEAPALAETVLVPLALLEDASSSIGHFISDEGHSAEDMQVMDNLDAYIAQHKAIAATTKETK